jgi:nucleoside-diphosphate kinase
MDLHAAELTLVLIKPDALKLSLTGYILSQFSEFHAGLRFAGAKIVHVTKPLAEEHYAEHRGKPFYPALIEYILGRSHYASEPEKRRVVAIVYCGVDAVSRARQIAGPTDPHNARERAPGTIRALGTVVPVRNAEGAVIGERMDNLVHASANQEEAEREIKLWFQPCDVVPCMRPYAVERCDDHYYYCTSDGRIVTAREPESRAFLAPGNLVWATDMEALRLLSRGEPGPCTANAVVAKYLINDEEEAPC